MPKVITFSRKFSSGHINQGKQTFFVEKILNGLYVNYKSQEYLERLLRLNAISMEKGKLSFEDIESFWLSLQPNDETKFHTIRSGFRIKKSEKISPRVWFGKPYNSPQIIFWKDLEIKSTQEFYNDNRGNWLVDKCVLNGLERITLSMGDGLKHSDMASWFDKEIHGQVISWTEGVVYGGYKS
jgi:hypothetical protein